MERQEELKQVVLKSGLPEQEASSLLTDFSEAVKLAAEWEAKAKTIVVTDESQVEEMAQARAARLELREKRIAAEKKHKELKESALRRGQALDKVKRFVVELIKPIEQYLDEQEHFVEIKQRAEEEERRRKADELLRQQEEKERQEREAVEAAKREEERKAREKAEAEAAEERAKREAAERKAEEDRKAAEAQREADRKKAEAERAAAEKAAAEKARKEAEAKAAEQRAAEEKRREEERMAARGDYRAILRDYEPNAILKAACVVLHDKNYHRIAGDLSEVIDG